MSMGINYNPSAIRAHLSLLSADRSLSTSLGRLSSGLRVQRTADDPAAMVLANNLRFTSKAVSSAINNSEDGINMIGTAEGAMDQMTEVMNKIRVLAVSALNDATMDANQLAALQADLDTAVSSLSRMATDNRYGTIALLDGTLGDNTLRTDSLNALSAIRSDHSKLPGGITYASALSVDFTAPLTATRSTVAKTFAGPPSGGTALSSVAAGLVGPALSITGPGGTVGPFTVSSAATIDSFVAQVNGIGKAIGVEAVYDSSTGELRVQNEAFGNLPLSFAVLAGLPGGATTAGSVAPATLNFSYTDASGTAQSLTLNHVASTQDGGLAYSNAAGDGVSTPPNYTVFAPGAFTAVLKDLSNGAASLTVPTSPVGTYGATRQSNVNIQTGALQGQQVNLEVPDMRANVLGRTAGLAGSTFGSLQSLTSGNNATYPNGALRSGQAASALRVIDAAMSELLAARAQAGAIASNALETTLSSLRVTQQSLSESESQMRDTDFAAESAEFAKQNILVQAATAMLAQANQVPQTVLQLLK